MKGLAIVDAEHRRGNEQPVPRLSRRQPTASLRVIGAAHDMTMVPPIQTWVDVCPACVGRSVLNLPPADGHPE